MADYDNDIEVGGSLSDVASREFARNKETATSLYDDYSNRVKSNFGKDRMTEIWENAKELPGNFVNNAIGTIGSNVDNAIRTGASNVENLVQGRIDNVVGRVEEKINNKVGNFMGKIEAKLGRGLLGKIDSFLGNPIANSFRDIFGGLVGNIRSELLKGRDPKHQFYIGPGAADITNITNAVSSAWDSARLQRPAGGSSSVGGSSGGFGSIADTIAATSQSNAFRPKNGQTTGRPGIGYGSRLWGSRGTTNTNPISPDGIDLLSTSSFSELAEKIKQSYGMTGNIDLGKDLERNFVNRLGVTLVDNVLGHTRTHIFIGKPTCHIIDDVSGKMPPTVQAQYDMGQFILRDFELFKQLNGRIPGSTAFMTALQNRVVGISFQDASLGVSESAANTRGIKQEYGTSYAESLANVPISLTFAMDRNAEAFKLTYVWTDYIEKVKEGVVLQHQDDALHNRMSYTCPIWVFCTEEDDMSIIYWCKLIGNYPRSIPFSIFSNQGIINRDIREITVSFSSSMFKPFDMVALYEFNEIQKIYQPKMYYDRWFPKEVRDLKYYWTSGAEVKYNSETGKYMLVPYNATGTVQRPRASKKAGGKNGLLSTIGGFANKLSSAAADPVGSFNSLVASGKSTAGELYDSAANAAKSVGNYASDKMSWLEKSSSSLVDNFKNLF